ncbi:MAG: M50 family metallopeptidase [Clostridia bacterium]|nr:M50 family metallopeptidase [Clostridia bacterium]MDD4375329.1 M50 family metallopeptidase [Clostridia bacterium]
MKLKIKDLIIEIEYILLISIVISCISRRVFSYLDMYYICLLFVIFHELSHIFIANIVNKKLRKIKITVGGCTAIFKNEYHQYKEKNINEILVLIAGPLSNGILALIFRNISFVFEINIFLMFLNLLPIYPLDGYRITEILLKIWLLDNYKKRKKILNRISITCLLLLSILVILILLIYKNISGLMFLVYLVLINCKYQ